MRNDYVLHFFDDPSEIIEARMILRRWGEQDPYIRADIYGQSYRALWNHSGLNSQEIIEEVQQYLMEDEGFEDS